MYGVGHARVQVGLEVKVEAVAARAVGVQDRERVRSGPGDIEALDAFDGLRQAVLDVHVVVGEAFVLYLFGHKLYDHEVGMEVGGMDVHAIRLIAGEEVARFDGPVGTDGGLLCGEETSRSGNDDEDSKGNDGQCDDDADSNAPPATLRAGCGCGVVKIAVIGHGSVLRDGCLMAEVYRWLKGLYLIKR